MAVGLIQRNHKQLRKADVTPQAFNKTNHEELEIVSLPDETLPSSIALPTETTEEQVTALPSPVVETQPAPLRRSTRIRKSPKLCLFELHIIVLKKMCKKKDFYKGKGVDRLY
ncbi:Hypothetical predicted protein [Paramuricea clavata]|uniref:Uncharacterized protein n=1 Tax=Paramuricea clavata TaxID=317549 RepID=A0A6S7HAS8_PARCT|nr:Hypothetical predicted protein [Paramuricea clavata]